MDEYMARAKEECLAQVSFDEIHQMMLAVGWTWGDLGTPSPAELRHEAARLLDTVIVGGHGTSCCGGFTANLEDGLLTLDWGTGWSADIYQ